MASKLTPKGEQNQEEDHAVIRHLFEHVYSRGRLDILSVLVGPEFRGSSSVSPDASFGLDGLKSHVIRLRNAFHGFNIDIDDLLVKGDNFEVVWTACGSHERRFLDIEPTCIIGQAGVEPHGIEMAVAGRTTGMITGGKIQESSMIWDIKELRHQLGPAVGASQRDTVHQI